MDHQEATNAKLLERYLLGELPEAQRDQFEEHYFSCPACAEELVSAQKFLDNARQPLLQLEKKEEHARAPVSSGPAQSRWDHWLAFLPKPALAGVCACLIAIVAWQSGSRKVEPEVLGSYFVTATRATGLATRKIQVATGQRRVALLFNRTDPSVNRYSFTLENSSGLKLQEFDYDAPADTNDLQVLIPVEGLPAGSYMLRVSNSTAHVEVAQLPFELLRP